MAFFTPLKNLYSLPEVYDDVIIANSQVITTGDMVNIVSGFADGADAGERIYGVAVGFVGGLESNKGIPLDKLVSGTDYDGTFTAGAHGTQAYTASADNQTDKKVMVRVRIDHGMVCSNVPDATIGTTTGSNLKGNYTDLITQSQVDENNNGNAFTTIAQLVILGVGGSYQFENVASTNGLYMIMEKQEMGG